MRQLNGIDASFLYMDKMRGVGHVCGLLIVDPAEAGHPINADTVREHLRSRIHLIPPMRWRLVTVPFGIDLPYWIDDPHLDLDYHVRGIALPSPGDDRQLATQVARLASRPLDRTHPLWEMYVIEGLEGGKVAIQTKLHHAAIDGAAGMQLMAILMDLEPDPASRDLPPPPEKVATEPVPSPVEMWVRGCLGVMGHPEAALRLGANAAKEALGIAKALGRPAGGDRNLPAVRAPKTPWNRSVSATRNYAFASLSLTEVRSIRSLTGATVNDVVMAICTGALRRWLIEHAALPDKPLLAMVPVSTRTADHAAGVGNQVTAITAELPTDSADPLEQLKQVHESMVKAKDFQKAVPASLLQDFSQFAAPAAAELVARTFSSTRMADYMGLPFNVVISNVPGPREPLYFSGALVEANFPVSIVADGAGLNITVQSYRDHLDFGLVSTPELTPDIWRLMSYFGDALRELSQVAAELDPAQPAKVGAAKSKTGRSVAAKA